MLDNNLYDCGEARPNSEYCNIHGDPLNVFESDAGELYVNLKDVKHTGFAIFRRDTFDSLTIDPDDITQEFQYFLMSQAKKYILRNRAHSIDEERLLRTIENVKRKVLGSATGNNKTQFKGQSEYKNQPAFRNPSKSINQLECRNHTYSRSRSGNRNQDGQNQKYDNRNGNKSHINIRKQENQNLNVNLSSFGGIQAVAHPTPKPPKKLPNNFGVYRKYATASFKQKKREKTNDESFQDNTNEIQKQTKTNSSTPSDFERNEKIQLEVGDIYEVEICYTEPEKENVCWVHEKESKNQLQDMMVEIYNIEPTLDTLNTLVKSQLVLGLYEDVWCRARIILPNSNLVHFLDYGNKSIAERIKPLPNNLKKIPALAVRLVVNCDKLPLEEGQQLSIKVNKKYDDGTYLVEAVNGNSLPKNQHSNAVDRPNAQIKQDHTFRAHSPDRESVVSVTEEKSEKNMEKKFKDVEKIQTETKETTYFNIPKPLISVNHGDTVWIVDFRDGKLYLQTKECLDKRNEIRDYIKELDKSELVISMVKEGQLVLCSKEGMSNLFRAVVEEIRDNSVVKVCYIDFPGTDTLSIKSLRNVDKYLSKEPSLMQPTQKLDYLKNISVSAKNYIAEIIQKKEELTVKISNNQMDFIQEDGQLLSQILSSFNKTLEVQEVETLPKSSNTAPEQVVTSTQNERFFYNDIPRIPLELGKHNFVCYSVENPNDLTLVLDRDDIIAHTMFLLDFTTDVHDAYKPVVNEICLVHDDEDGRCYRAVVDGIEDDKYIMHGLDFGGKMSVKSDKLRSPPKYLKEIPIIGIRCEVAGFIASPEMTDKFKKAVKEHENLTANVLEFVDKTQKYVIEIPGLK